MESQSAVLRDTRDFRLGYKQRRRFSRPGLRAFLKISEKWGLTGQEQMALLGMKSFVKFAEARRNERMLTSIELEIISIVLRIYKRLRILLPNDADKWMKKPNDYFGGDSALEFILGKEKVKMVKLENLILVYHYLESNCG